MNEICQFNVLLAGAWPDQMYLWLCAWHMYFRATFAQLLRLNGLAADSASPWVPSQRIPVSKLARVPANIFFASFSMKKLYAN